MNILSMIIAAVAGKIIEAAVSRLINTEQPQLSKNSDATFDSILTNIAMSTDGDLPAKIENTDCTEKTGGNAKNEEIDLLSRGFFVPSIMVSSDISTDDNKAFTKISLDAKTVSKHSSEALLITKPHEELLNCDKVLSLNLKTNFDVSISHCSYKESFKEILVHNNDQRVSFATTTEPIKMFDNALLTDMKFSDEPFIRDNVRLISSESLTKSTKIFENRSSIIAQNSSTTLFVNETTVPAEGIAKQSYSNGDASDTVRVRMVNRQDWINELHGNISTMTKGDAVSMKVSLDPEGIGRLDIELVLNNGVINGRINASEAIGREVIERNILNIVDTLQKEGLNVGGFSVLLRDNGNYEQHYLMKENMEAHKTEGLNKMPVVLSSQGIVSIFV